MKKHLIKCDVVMNTAVHTESLRCVQDARHFSNPTRNERSECRVGYAVWVRGCVSETHYYLRSNEYQPPKISVKNYVHIYKTFHQNHNHYEKTDTLISGMHDDLMRIRSVEKNQHCRERQGQNRHGFDNA